MARRARIQVGEVTAPRTLETLRGDLVSIPDPTRLVHLQFRRFAGCPICELHLRAFAKRHEELVSCGVREVVLFHSKVSSLRPYQGAMPFDVVADPNRVVYNDFGVTQSPLVLADLRTWRAMVRGMRFGEGPIPVRPDGGPFGLPADFLLDTSGRVLEVKYGEHPDDQWPLDHVLELARTVR